MKQRLTVLAFVLVLVGCTGTPEGIEPVTGFDKDRYLGTWYEIARLDHSFFGPFYASYIIFELDQAEYSEAYITGYNRDYLWFMARTPTVSSQAMTQFKTRARQEGFDLDELILVDKSLN